MDSEPRPDTLSFLGLVFSASIVVAVALPHSPAAPLISAFIPVAVPSASVSTAYIAGEGGWVTAVVMTAVAIAVLRIARRTVWRPAEQSQLIST
jgi:hypothetical protein